MAARALLSFLKGRLPTIGRVCTRSSGANIAAEFSSRRIIKPVAQLISKRETETEVEKGSLRTGDAFDKHRMLENFPYLRTGSRFDSRVSLDFWRSNACCRSLKPDAGNAFIKHSVLENYLTNNDKCVFYGMCRYRHGCETSKSWFTVLSLDDDGNVLPKYEISPPYPLYNYSLYGICNGVFCYAGFVNNGGDEHDVCLYHLWNPATNEVKTLPEAEAPYARTLSHCVCFDDKSQDYKVMRFVRNLSSWNLEFELYSLKTDSWKKISCAEFCRASSWLSVSINGVFYTTAYRKEGSGEEVILAFDISTETIFYLPLHGIINEKKAFHLLDYNGMLSILSFVPDGTGTTDYEHWVMSNGSWLKLSVFHTCNAGRPLYFSRNGELLFFRCLIDYQLLVFDSATGKLKHIDDWTYFICDLFPFSESFMKLNGVSGPEFTSWIMSMRKKLKQVASLSPGIYV